MRWGITTVGTLTALVVAWWWFTRWYWDREEVASTVRDVELYLGYAPTEGL